MAIAVYMLNKKVKSYKYQVDFCAYLHSQFIALHDALQKKVIIFIF